MALHDEMITTASKNWNYAITYNQDNHLAFGYDRQKIFDYDRMPFSTNFYTIKGQNIENYNPDSQIDTDYEVRIEEVVSEYATGGKKGKNYRVLSFRKRIEVPIGCKFEFFNEIWIANNINGDLLKQKKVQVHRCNILLRARVNGEIHVEPGYMETDNVSYADPAYTEDTTFLYPKLTISLQQNTFTMDIKANDEYIFALQSGYPCQKWRVTQPMNFLDKEVLKVSFERQELDLSRDDTVNLIANGLLDELNIKNNQDQIEGNLEIVTSNYKAFYQYKTYVFEANLKRNNEIIDSTITFSFSGADEDYYRIYDVTNNSFAIYIEEPDYKNPLLITILAKTIDNIEISREESIWLEV
jgi:hypothetical protein